jgi:hypothetical protein
MMLLDKLTELRGLCHTEATTCGGDIESVAQGALAALERVDEVVWGWPTSGWVETPPRRWNITEPYTLNTSLVHDVLDTVAAAVERIDQAIAGLRVKTDDSIINNQTDDYPSYYYYNTTTPAPLREIGWWWISPPTTNDPGVEGLLAFARKHKRIVSTIIMRCGVLTSGGGIAGDVTAACQHVIPKLNALGIKTELWLGNDGSLASARLLFANKTRVAAALQEVSKRYPGITGYNIDLEQQEGTYDGNSEDIGNYAVFLAEVTRTLNANSIRFSADVACYAPVESFDGQHGLAADCERLAKSGVYRLMNMRTYNAYLHS